MKNRFLSLLLSIPITLSLLFSPVGAKQPGNPPVDRQPLKATLIGGAPDAVWYMVLNGIGVCISKSYPHSVVTLSPGAGVANVIRVNNAQVDGGLTYNTTAFAATGGNDPFKEKLNNIAAVAALYPSHFQFVLRKKLGIKSIDQLVAKKMKLRISVDKAGGTGEIILKHILEEYGVTFDDIRKWGGEILYKNMTDSCAMLAEGRIDGYGMSTLYPAPSFQETALNTELVMLTVNPRVIERLCQKYGHGKGIIPAKTYKFTPKSIATITSDTIILVPKSSPNELAYKIARSLHENLEYFRSIHSNLSELTPAKLAQNLGVPPHPGALQYYREAGIVKSKH